MITFLNENSELNNRTFPLAKGIRKHLKQVLQNYEGDKTVDGYKRLNNLLASDTVSFKEMKRIKNFFDNFSGTRNSVEYILNGGDEMNTWVNNTLNTARTAVHDFKQAKKDAGFNNAFIKHHSKDRQNREDKPTQVKIKTDNLNKKISNNDTLRFESLIRESDTNEEHIFYDYLSEYDATYVFDDFLNNPQGKQNWGVLINPSMYQKALQEFTRFGYLYKFPEKYVHQWMGIIMKNTAILIANTEIAGHSQYFPFEAFEDFLESYCEGKGYNVNHHTVQIEISFQEFKQIINSYGIELTEGFAVHKNGQYNMFLTQDEVDDYDKQQEENELKEKYSNYVNAIEKYNEKKKPHDNGLFLDLKNGKFYKEYGIFDFLYEIGITDKWMVLPDGSDAWSDYGLSPIQKLICEYNEDMSANETLVLINKIIDVYHCRGDLSSAFIQGGKHSLTQTSYGLGENKYNNKIICITESQLKYLTEAQKETFSFEELSNIKSFRGRYNYCLQHIGNPCGKGSSRAVFQLDDEKVLKLAFNSKGIAQNGAECDMNLQNYGVVPKIFKWDYDDQWIVSEFVLPAKEKDFKECLGLTFDEFVMFIRTSWSLRHGNHKKWCGYVYSEEEYCDMVENNEDLANFDNYIGDYRPPEGDLTRLANYGMTMRDGYPTIVLLDSGLTEGIWDTYYKRR